MKPYFYVILFSLLVFKVHAQTDSLLNEPDTLKTALLIMPDSTESMKNPFDTSRGKRFKKVSTQVISDVKKIVGVDTFSLKERPKIIFWRSLFIPSFGQFMNRDYWKVPLVYVGAAVGVGTIQFNNRNYKKYIGIVENMYLSNEQARPHPDHPGSLPIDITQYSRAAAQYKRWRDFSYIGMGLGWTLFAVEANVSAHLKTFDISDDISFKLEPIVLPTGVSPVAGIKLSFNFK